jgi:inner membrane protein
MASFGHVAVGLLTARLHGGGPTRTRPRPGWRALALFAALATLPDADIALVALGASDAGPFGHRGAMHSLAMAVAVGLGGALAARRWRWPVGRTALAAFAAVASHTLLDLLDDGGKSLAIFWPLSSARYHLPWRLLPDAPRGLGLLSGAGLLELATEFALFLPVTIYALWPHVLARTRQRRPSSLRLVAGQRDAEQAPASSPRSVERDPPLRSSG